MIEQDHLSSTYTTTFIDDWITVDSGAVWDISGNTTFSSLELDSTLTDEYELDSTNGIFKVKAAKIVEETGANTTVSGIKAVNVDLNGSVVEGYDIEVTGDILNSFTTTGSTFTAAYTDTTIVGDIQFNASSAVNLTFASSADVTGATATNSGGTSVNIIGKTSTQFSSEPSASNFNFLFTVTVTPDQTGMDIAIWDTVDEDVTHNLNVDSVDYTDLVNGREYYIIASKAGFAGNVTKYTADGSDASISLTSLDCSTRGYNASEDLGTRTLSFAEGTFDSRPSINWTLTAGSENVGPAVGTRIFGDMYGARNSANDANVYNSVLLKNYDDIEQGVIDHTAIADTRIFDVQNTNITTISFPAIQYIHRTSPSCSILIDADITGAKAETDTYIFSPSVTASGTFSSEVGTTARSVLALSNNLGNLFDAQTDDISALIDTDGDATRDDIQSNKDDRDDDFNSANGGV